MRLFAQWDFILSDSNEPTVAQVNSQALKESLSRTKQMVTYGDAGSATIGPEANYFLPWADATPSKARILDFSINGHVYLHISQGGSSKVMSLCGSLKLPARVTISLASDVTQVYVQSREPTAQCAAKWFYTEFDDINDTFNFPVV